MHARIGSDVSHSMRKLRVCALLCLAGVLAWSFEDAAVVDWIRTNAIPFKTSEHGQGFEDLQPLKKIIGNARIVALGEATHGTREFFQLKHRLLEFLNVEMGFTILAVETDMASAYPLGTYIRSGPGDARQLLRDSHWFYNQENLSLVNWMKEANKTEERHLEFAGIDMQVPGAAAAAVRQFVSKADPQLLSTVSQAADGAMRQPQRITDVGSVVVSLPLSVGAGKRIRLGGRIRTDSVTGSARLFIYATGPFGNVSAKDPADLKTKGSTDSQTYEVELIVPENTTNINFGASLTGDGTAWFSDLALSTDDEEYPKTGVELLFPGKPPEGPWQLGSGYRARLEAPAALQIHRVAADPGRTLEDRKALVASWGSIAQRLESSRSAYLKQGIPATDIAWVIQCARLVQQCMDMRSSPAAVNVRDASMAQNVQWLLEQSPKAKIVVSAANGHVSTAKYGSFEPMGLHLRRMYGDQLVVFGFSFNRGSFQAYERTKGLKVFTVPPPPTGSLDATLAATGIPMFAFDLRRMPTTSPVADWLAKPRQTRSIGGVYVEDAPYQYMAALDIPNSFDVLLFVENTTAVRKVE